MHSDWRINQRPRPGRQPWHAGVRINKVLSMMLSGGGELRLRAPHAFDCLLFAFDAQRHGAAGTARQPILARLKGVAAQARLRARAAVFWSLLAAGAACGPPHMRGARRTRCARCARVLVVVGVRGWGGALSGNEAHVRTWEPATDIMSVAGAMRRRWWKRNRTSLGGSGASGAGQSVAAPLAFRRGVRLCRTPAAHVMASA